MATTTAYPRVSTDKQTLENQRSEILRFVNKKGITVDKWVEEVVSGKVRDSDRKLGIILKKTRKGDTIIVSELSRLSRCAKLFKLTPCNYQADPLFLRY